MDFGALWRQEQQVRRKPDDASAWDKRAQEFTTKYGPSGYSLEFLRLADLKPGESVFDMGCGAGALAIPCAERGHRVLAADFSPAMLERCLADAPEGARDLIETKLLAWDDNWDIAGLRVRSFDVAFASRSIATADMKSAILKLSRVARRKVCITLVTGKSPRVSAAFFRDMGLTCMGHQDAAFAFGIACQLGYEPEVRFINSVRADRYASLEEAQDAHANMLRFADQTLHGEVLARKEAEARAWVEAHLRPAGEVDGAWAAPVREVERDLPLCIDVPRTFSWAFLSWNTGDA